MELYLIRHGLTRANLEHRFCGRTDWPLLPEALKDLDQLIRSKQLPAVDVVCHTGLLRARQTAEYLFPGVPVQAAPALAEMDFGDFEALTHEELQDHPAYARWLVEFETLACPNGESQAEFVSRVRRGWQALLSQWSGQVQASPAVDSPAIEKAALVTHGGVIAVLLNDWFPGDRSLLGWQPACGSGYRVSFSAGRPMQYQPICARTT